jgi:hypothetical protein
VSVLGSSGRNPDDDLPQGTPKPRQWPRLVQLSPSAGGAADDAAVLASTNAAWPLPAASCPPRQRPARPCACIPGLAGIASVTPVPVMHSGAAGYTVARSGPLARLPDGTRLILTGPYGPGPPTNSEQGKSRRATPDIQHH